MPAFLSLRLFWPLALVLGLTACASAPRGSGPATPSSDVLAQTSWELARWTRPGGALRPVPHSHQAERPITMVFTHEQGRARLSGFAGCNNYASEYVVANGTLVVTQPPISTRMACLSSDAAQRERDFLEGLTRITASKLNDDTRAARLTLVLASGDVLDFARQNDPIAGGQQGPTKLVYVAGQRGPCSAGAGQAMCYQVRDNPALPWQRWYGEIVGFNFQPGIEYRLRVVEQRDPNPPADASAVRWVLDAVIEQRVVTP